MTLMLCTATSLKVLIEDRTLRDLEDIVTVVDGRPAIVDDVGAADREVRAYISAEIGSLLKNPDFTEALVGFLLPDAASQDRRAILEQRLAALSR